MKQLLSFAVLAGLLVLAGCSGSSPSSGPTPTVTPATWAITLTASSSNPYANEAVLVHATVTKDGSSAPDGTTIVFSVPNSQAASCDDGCLLNEDLDFASGVIEAQVTTSGGVASVYFGATGAGAFQIKAQVSSVTRSLTVTWREPPTTSDLQIYSVVPDYGSLGGWEQVRLQGKGILAPVEVFFVIGSGRFQAITDQVSEPSSVFITTPEITGVDLTQEWTADVEVTRGVGTSYAQTFTLSGAFRFTPTSAEPEIYVLVPDRGTPRGGDSVTIYGQNFSTDSIEVDFNGLPAEEVVVSSDGRQVMVITPQYSAQPLQDDVSVSVQVCNQPNSNQESCVTKANAWVWAGEGAPTPEIYSVSPNSGPIEGGTQVTVFGAGFGIGESGSASPVEVYFEDTGTIGSREAEVVYVAADGSQVICVSPDITVSQPTPPVTVSVRVLNTSTGLEGTADGAFTYGETMFITGNSPTEGRSGDLVTIYGSGFRDPSLVALRPLGGDTESELDLEVIAISGTEIVVRLVDWVPPSCADIAAEFVVTHIESDAEAIGGTFLYLGYTPSITWVEPATVQQTLLGGGVDWECPDAIAPTTITIHGNRFVEPLRVEIDQYVVPSSDLTLVDDQTIVVANIPTPCDINLTFDSIQCYDDNTGTVGTQRMPTAVNVTVTSVIGNCPNILPDGLTYEPACPPASIDPDGDCCVSGPAIRVTLAGVDVEPGVNDEFDFCSAVGTVVIGSSQTGPDILVFSEGGDPLTWSAALGAPNPGDFNTIPAGANGVLNPGDPPDGFVVEFAPLVEGDRESVLTITSNDSSNPAVTITFLGCAELPPKGAMVTSPYGDGDTWPFPDTPAGGCSDAQMLTIANDGNGDLADVSTMATGPFAVATPPRSALAAGESTQTGVMFCPVTDNGDYQDGTLSVSSSNDTTGTVVINLRGREEPS